MMNLVNKTLVVISIMSFISGFSQVGINTPSPNASLDVNGDVVLRNELRVNGTNSVNGSPGSVDQVLVSQGEGLAPVWKSVNVPFMENTQYKLINTYIKDDQVGLAGLTGAATTPATSSIKENISSSTTWKKIPGLSTQLEIKSDKNNTTYQLQTGVELVAAANQTVGFICGIFKDNVLVAIRPDKITSVAAAPIQGIFTLNYTEANSPKGLFTMDVACRVTSTTANANVISIGVNTNNSNTGSNAFALKSFFKVDVAELVTYTN